MPPRARGRRADMSEPSCRAGPVYRDVRVYYAPAGAKRLQLTQNLDPPFQGRHVEIRL
jgi:hypothetical protein